MSSLQPVREEGAVGEPGEHVMECVVMQPPLRHLAPGDVLVCHDDPDGPRVSEAGGPHAEPTIVAPDAAGILQGELGLLTAEDRADARRLLQAAREGRPARLQVIRTDPTPRPGQRAVPLVAAPRLVGGEDRPRFVEDGDADREGIERRPEESTQSSLLLALHPQHFFPATVVLHLRVHGPGAAVLDDQDTHLGSLRDHGVRSSSLHLPAHRHLLRSRCAVGRR